MCYGVDCFGTYFTHVQSCDVTRVQSATLLRYTSMLMFWTFDLRQQVCIFGMHVEIYAMARFSLVLVLFDLSVVVALLCPLSGITFIDTSLQNLQIFICLHHIEIWLVGIFQIISKDALLWLELGHEWWWTNTAYSCLSNMDSQRKLWEKFIQVWSSVSHYAIFTFVLSTIPWSIFSPKPLLPL